MSRVSSLFIGVPIPVELADFRVWSKKASHTLDAHYAEHLRASGATVLLLPVPAELPDNLAELEAEAAAVVERLDGLVIAGGSDVDPRHYGAQAAPESGPFDAARDAWEIALTRAAAARQVPVLGICRGLQVINTVFGGTLIQHLPPVVGSDIHNPEKHAFVDHTINTCAGTWLRDVIGESQDVATYHHQAVERPAAGFAVSALAEDDTIEALEDLSRGIVGVQWHPEAHTDGRIFDAFMDLVKTKRAVLA